MKISYFLNPLGRGMAVVLSALTLSVSGGGLTALAQEKLTISVPEFKNETSWWWWQRGTSRELADALSNELSSTGNFTVVERQKLDQVLSEQELVELGLVRPETAPESGNLTGAKYIILGRVSSYEEGVSRESSGGRVGGFNIGPINLGSTSNRSTKQEAYVAIDLRVVDTTTAEVVYSRTVEGRAIGESQSVSSGFSILGLGMSGDQQTSNKPPVSKALRATLIEITDYLNCVMVVQGSCLAEFEAKEERRRDNTRGVLELD
ncbi:CsgG/HfaB family protein [Crocosphaera sp. Alani8]|uniref:CsgG/HfaB family protein n=1 Tax=Crocosphaera sp. Alani8 TaxID=3038952 RepID=UPI00313BC57D